MNPDDELCLCFHVTKRKVVNYLRIEKPRRVGQLADCFGAGTGCGWCRPFLRRLFEAHQKGLNEESGLLPDKDEYALGRTSYVQSGKGTPPPGGTPVGNASAEQKPVAKNSENRPTDHLEDGSTPG